MGPVRYKCALLLSWLLLLPSPVPAGEDQEESTSEGTLEDELRQLEEADFPDLVGVGEKSDLMEELEFLEEAGMVELPARHPQMIGVSPSAVTVITRDDIEASGACNVPDLLRMVPGMDVVAVSPYLTSIVSRLFWTFENHHYLVLVDGREINIELLGQPLWVALPISLNEIERIEIIRGPGSAVYGANAVTGVVSITTLGVGEKLSGFAGVQAGEAANLMMTARVAVRFGDWGFAASAGFEESGMLRNPAELGKRAWKARLMGEYRWSESRHVLLDLGFSSNAGPLITSAGTIDIESLIGAVRLEFVSQNIKAHLYWMPSRNDGSLDLPLQYQGIRLAEFPDFRLHTQTINGEIQWSTPGFWEPLLIIVGATARASQLSSDTWLDAETFSNPNSGRFREMGISDWELRAGAFVHTELTPFDWMIFTAGTRLDVNSVTGYALSPRVAAVFRPVASQFFRLATSRSFRMPAFHETGLHLAVTFPEDSPIKGGDQDRFQDFMLQTFGNPDLQNETLTAFEVGYRGEFLHKRLSVSLELFHNTYRNEVTFESKMVNNAQGLPDLENSYLRHVNTRGDRTIVGSELSLRYTYSRALSLTASWTLREVFFTDTGQSDPHTPKNLISMGGRFRAERGLVISLFLKSRSEFWDPAVTDPKGFMEPALEQHLGNDFLVLGRLGWSWDSPGTEMEAGLRLFLPVSLESPHFQYYERGGGETLWGTHYCGDRLRRVVSLYLQGSF